VNRILVLGASGQLATHLRELLPEASYWGRAVFDLSKGNNLVERIRSYDPDFIVNAAGYTAVDQAESEPDAAWRLNAETPAMAARAAALLHVPFVHVSTDYVFDGAKNGAYAVHDTPHPINVYGKSKLAGELAVQMFAPRSWILRTSWVFSEFGSNFVKTILRLAKTRAELRVVSDQTGCPTYAGDLAKLIEQMIRHPDASQALPFGTYHAVGGPATTWCEFATNVIEHARRQGLLSSAPHVLAVKAAEYPTKALRPLNSLLAPSPTLQSAFSVHIDWTRALSHVVGRLSRLDT
jgi:dTDP-4-dehydrorhamnose reductase